MMEANVM